MRVSRVSGIYTFQLPALEGHVIASSNSWLPLGLLFLMPNLHHTPTPACSVGVEVGAQCGTNRSLSPVILLTCARWTWKVSFVDFGFISLE